MPLSMGIQSAQTAILPSMIVKGRELSICRKCHCVLNSVGTCTHCKNLSDKRIFWENVFKKQCPEKYISFSEIGRLLGKPHYVVRKWAKDLKVSFKKPSKLYHSEEWLKDQYLIQKRTIREIAKLCGVTMRAICVFMEKFGIKTRNQSEIRKIKFWNQAGEKNGMFGKTGIKNPNWRGGISKARDKMAITQHWKKMRKIVRERDKCCRLCGSIYELHLHHIERVSDAPLLVYDPHNVILLCSKCHRSILGKEEKYKGTFFQMIGEPSGSKILSWA